MIKFFRKIRQNLLNEGKTTKYLKYAIGEIILIAITQKYNQNSNTTTYSSPLGRSLPAEASAQEGIKGWVST
ncbi:MAG: hypothetical protein CO117_06940 [Flavobacteriaceae bacterium CG_4_9_14_3_um_filter_33_16]|nr:MAG: hypothetical protein CO117_06940 [Flavobacteriaceae bacterium CG_4_9_14_3_um_filter_33_16]